MNELLRHLANDEVASLYSDYNHTTSEVYNVLYFAVRDHADELHLTDSNFAWLKGGKLIKSSKISGKSAKYRAELERILDQDEIVKTHTKVTQTDPTDFVVALVALVGE